MSAPPEVERAYLDLGKRDGILDRLVVVWKVSAIGQLHEYPRNIPATAAEVQISAPVERDEQRLTLELAPLLSP